MIDRPYCKEHYAECVCSRCKYDREDCCGRGQFRNYLCPFNSCSEFKPITAADKRKENSDDSKGIPEPGAID